MKPLSEVLRLRPEHTKALGRLGITTTTDLLLHLPTRYTDPQTLTTIEQAHDSERVSIAGKIASAKTGRTWRGKQAKAEATLEDISGERLHIIWFNQPYMARYLQVGDVVIATGTISTRNGTRSMVNPAVEQTGSDTLLSSGQLFSIESGGLFPIYRETRGISSHWINTQIKKLLAEGMHEKLNDPIPQKVREQLSLPDLRTALVWIHTPRDLAHATSARKRFAFSEIFLLQAHRQTLRQSYRSLPTHHISDSENLVKKFLGTLPFTPTGAQQSASQSIAYDIASGHPMCRLLEGDVGSGKTAVAAAVSYAVLTQNTTAALQVAVMAPTDILARQHLQTFIELFKNSPIKIGYLSGTGCYVYPSKTNPTEGTKISKAQLKRWIEDGRVRLLIGTHALIQKSVSFKHLALAIIDEQHRFGITQRKKLTSKQNVVPHLLSMTATPIPRTLALSIFGDLDLCVLDELPPGRKPTQTSIVPPHERQAVYQHMREHLSNSEQIFVVCPRINPADPNDQKALKVRSAQETKDVLIKELPEYRIELIHSKLKPAEKESTMDRFAKGDIDILVSTSVVEVGVDVPNATMMVIEGAERFGLAQLHQLRGRVGRGSQQAHCYLIPGSDRESSLKRLEQLSATTSGFELAEYDLEHRGPGALTGTKQWGVSDIAMEALKNLKLVEFARNLAKEIIENDPELKQHPELAAEISKIDEKLHLE